PRGASPAPYRPARRGEPPRVPERRRDPRAGGGARQPGSARAGRGWGAPGGAWALGSRGARARGGAGQLPDGEAEQALLPEPRAGRDGEAALLEEPLGLPGHREESRRGGPWRLRAERRPLPCGGPWGRWLGDGWAAWGRAAQRGGRTQRRARGNPGSRRRSRRGEAGPRALAVDA